MWSDMTENAVAVKPFSPPSAGTRGAARAPASLTAGRPLARLGEGSPYTRTTATWNARACRFAGALPYARTTGFDRVPIPSIVISTRSPALTGPHPGGAPVMTTSPGSRVNAIEA